MMHHQCEEKMMSPMEKFQKEKPRKKMMRKRKRGKKNVNMSVK
jgi:hypothetical protein